MGFEIFFYQSPTISKKYILKNILHHSNIYIYIYVASAWHPGGCKGIMSLVHIFPL